MIKGVNIEKILFESLFFISMRFFFDFLFVDQNIHVNPVKLFAEFLQNSSEAQSERDLCYEGNINFQYN
jgi:hypothetical protein